jgi:hypothetical protein
VEQLVRTATAAIGEDFEPETALADGAKSEIAELVKLCRALPEGIVRPDRLEALRRVAHGVGGLGAAMGHPLLAEIAASLSMLLGRIMEDGARLRVTPLRKAAIAMHVRNLSHIAEQGRMGAGAEAGARLVAGLRAVAEKASA